MIIHPGFLKSATTTLQNHLFSRHPDLFSIGRPHRSDLNARVGLELRKIEGVDYDEERLRGLIENALAAVPPGRTPVLSDETLTSNAYLLHAVADRLHTFFPDARVVFTLRNQLDVVRSFYARHGRVLGNAPRPYADRHVAFPEWLAHAWRNLPAGPLAIFDYYTSVRVYERLFGRDGIHVLLFERLKDDPDGFVRSLAAVLEIDPAAARDLLAGRHDHRRESTRHVLYDRFKHRFIPSSWLRRLLPYTSGLRSVLRQVLDRGARARVVMPNEWVPRLEDLYREGNGALAKSYGLPLSDYEYPV